MSNHSFRMLLLPLTPLYRFGLSVRESSLSSGREPIRRLRWPVISIGNLSTGGTGKTPLTIALAQALTRRGIGVDVLSRGYRRSSREAVRVDPNGSVQDFGDEPLVIAREAAVPVYVAAERYDAGALAEADDAALRGVDASPADHADVSQGHDRKPELNLRKQAESIPENEGASSTEGKLPLRVHLLDDGFQHRQLARDIDILLLNHRDWHDHMLPAGNLREPRTALRRAHAVAIPAGDPDLEAQLERYGWDGPIWRLRRQMKVPAIAGPVIAFCGIAHSQQFFSGLEAAGLHLASRISFADHHPYVAHDIDCMLDAARSVKAAAFVTTDKDRVRLGALAAKLSAYLPLETAELHIAIEDEAAAIDWLTASIDYIYAARK